MEKRTIAEAIADFYLPKSGWNDEFVTSHCLRLTPRDGSDDLIRLSLQVRGGHSGQKLFIFDHRPEVVEAARFCKVTLSQEALEVFAQPAWVVVKKKFGQYLNLLPIPRHYQPTARLYFGGFFAKKAKTGFRIEDDRSLWSWTSTGGIPGRQRGTIVVALVDAHHPLVIKSWGYANFCGNLTGGLTTIVGSSLERHLG